MRKWSLKLALDGLQGQHHIIHVKNGEPLVVVKIVHLGFLPLLQPAVPVAHLDAPAHKLDTTASNEPTITAAGK